MLHHVLSVWSATERQNLTVSGAPRQAGQHELSLTLWPLSARFTAPFNNMRNLKFKSPPTVAFSLPSINVAEVLENE